MAKTPKKRKKTTAKSAKTAGASKTKAKKTAKPKSTASRGKAAPSASGKHLVIVESPTKAKTINKYLGKDYVVMASVGHVRDLPRRAPKGVKQEVPGVDLENDFTPTYDILPTRRRKPLPNSRKPLKKPPTSGSRPTWTAKAKRSHGTWPRRLGVPSETAKRVVFNAITQSEIEQAFSNPHSIDEHKVNAQQARRILDRIVGYQVSPLLWKKVAGGLSAGRVQIRSHPPGGRT